MSSWQVPKVDWSASAEEVYNVDPDYLRLSENLKYLKEKALSMYVLPNIDDLIDQTYIDIPTAAIFNRIEESLDTLSNALNISTLQFERKTWYANSPGPTYADINRWESFQLSAYNILTQQFRALPKLRFTLGGVQFG